MITTNGVYEIVLTPQQQLELQIAAQQGKTTLTLGKTKVDITFYAAKFDLSNKMTAKGAYIDANPEGDCKNCRWVQTVSRTGQDEHEPRSDRETETAPLYPPGVHKPNDAANFFDEPFSVRPGTFTTVSTLGISDKANKTFKVIGSMTWGYKIDKKGNLSGVAPRVATKAEQARSLDVLRRESPTWTIGP